MYDKWAWRAQNKNGEIDRSKLAEIVPTQNDWDLHGPGIMHPDAARAISAMLFDAKEAGAGDVWCKYSYRPIAVQWEKWRAYLARGKTPPIVAEPGTSNHGWAVTVDLHWSKSSSIQWFHANCAKYGFKFDVPSENWHMTYQPGDIRPAVLEAEKEMGYADFKEGVKAKKDGKNLPDNASVDFAFGYRLEERATTLPKPTAGSPGPHTHEATVKLT